MSIIDVISSHSRSQLNLDLVVALWTARIRKTLKAVSPPCSGRRTFLTGFCTACLPNESYWQIPFLLNESFDSQTISTIPFLLRESFPGRSSSIPSGRIFLTELTTTNLLAESFTPSTRVFWQGFVPFGRIFCQSSVPFARLFQSFLLHEFVGTAPFVASLTGHGSTNW